MCLNQVMVTLNYLNGVANDAESTQNSKIIASLKSKTMSKLKNKIPGLCLLISSSPGSSLRTHADCDVNKRYQSLAW